jgi:asparagine synthase (glutamine-hydrolysing)
MFRFVAFMWDAASPDCSGAAATMARKLCGNSHDWGSVHATRGLAVFAADESRAMAAHRLVNAAGVVLGEIFERSSDEESEKAARDAVFGEIESRRVLDRKGRNLATEYWGNYVAFVVDASACRTLLVKDPTGSLPCYCAEHEGVRIVFSCFTDCVEIGCIERRINWAFIRARAVNGAFEVETDPLVGVTRVYRGECLTFNQRGGISSREFYWHPLRFANAGCSIDDPHDAARVLRATVRSCVHAQARHHSNVLQQTSGGLDSSIVLGCLADAPATPEITCYTNYVSDAACDERRWARYAAEAHNLRHIEVRHDPGNSLFKYMPPLAPSLEPVSGLAHWLRGPVERGMAAKHGATAVFTGENGDAIFCGTTYVFAVDNSMARYGIGLKTLRAAAQVAVRRDQTVWQVLADAMRRRRAGASMNDYAQQLTYGSRLLTRDAKVSVAIDHFPNPWFSGEPEVPMEQIWRLGMLVIDPRFYDLSTSQHAALPLTQSPLCAQPVVEIAARIPVHVHFENGIVRGLARRAFEREVPASILRRQWKDRPLSPISELVQKNAEFIREVLLEGQMVKENILDRAGVELALRCGPTRSEAMAGEILGHMDLEMWIGRNSI